MGEEKETKYKQKTRTEKDHLNEIERINYKTALKGKQTLNAIHKTTDKTFSLLYEQREQLEQIAEESSRVENSLEKGKELSVKMKRAGKLVVIGDKISDKIKSLFKPSKPKKLYEPARSVRREIPLEQECSPKIEEAPTETATNEVLISIRNGLKSLKSKLEDQNQEIEEQIPLIKDITKTNERSADDAFKVMKNLKRL